VEAWIGGEPMQPADSGKFNAVKVPEKATVVALRITPDKHGITGGELISEPVTVKTNGSGKMPLGDWSEMGILHNYSGGVRYRTQVSLTAEEAGKVQEIDLGSVGGTAEVIINGKRAGIKVAPPWKQDIKGRMKAGENSIEILVYNTLSNHYQTLPSRYRGKPVSGLLSGVRLVMQ
jgi:hypothetical protein